MFGWCKSMTFGINTSNMVILEFCGFMYFLIELLLHIGFGWSSLELISITFKSLVHANQFANKNRHCQDNKQ